MLRESNHLICKIKREGRQTCKDNITYLERGSHIGTKLLLLGLNIWQSRDGESYCFWYSFSKEKNIEQQRETCSMVILLFPVVCFQSYRSTYHKDVIKQATIIISYINLVPPKDIHTVYILGGLW